MKTCKVVATALAATLSAAAAAPGAAAQDSFPTKPVNLIVGFSAGGGTDTYARGLASVAPEYLDGQPLVVVNKPGGGGIPAARFVADQPPDGYTLHLSSLGGFILRDIARDQVVDPFEDFRYVGTVGGLTTGVAVPAGSPYRTVDDLVAALRERPGELRWAHTGRGNAHHIAGVGFLQGNDLDAQDIPFKGGAPARAAIVGEQVDFGFIGTQQLTGFEDQMRLLAVASDERLATNPEAPTFKELGYEYVGMEAPITVQAPAGTPDEVVDYLARAFEGMATDPAYQELMAKAALPSYHLGPEEAKARAESLRDSWAPIIAGLQG